MNLYISDCKKKKKKKRWISGIPDVQNYAIIYARLIEISSSECQYCLLSSHKMAANTWCIQ